MPPSRYELDINIALNAENYINFNKYYLILQSQVHYPTLAQNETNFNVLSYIVYVLGREKLTETYVGCYSVNFVVKFINYGEL